MGQTVKSKANAFPPPKTVLQFLFLILVQVTTHSESDPPLDYLLDSLFWLTEQVSIFSSPPQSTASKSTILFELNAGPIREVRREKFEVQQTAARLRSESALYENSVVAESSIVDILILREMYLLFLLVLLSSASPSQHFFTDSDSFHLNRSPQ